MAKNPTPPADDAGADDLTIDVAAELGVAEGLKGGISPALLAKVARILRRMVPIVMEELGG
jgi:hypothetical protein